MHQTALRPTPLAPEFAAAELRALEHLRTAIDGNADLTDVQARIAAAVTGELGFAAAVVGLVDPAQTTLGAWVGSDGVTQGEFAALGPLRMVADPVSRAFARPGQVVRATLAGQPRWLLALRYREQPVGLLAVATTDGAADRPALTLLEHFAVHGAEAIAGVRLCVERTQRLAVEAERNRISVEMHDAVIQSLFAIVCSLDGCARLTAHGDPAAVPELERVQRLAQKTLEQLRRSIHDLWPGELLERQFVGELREHVADLADLSSQLLLEIDVTGPLTALAPDVRRGLFRVAQEALNNVLKHARARRASVRLDATDDPVRLTVEDDGCGIPAGRPEHTIGILGMRNRLASLGGRLTVGPGPGGGTLVTATVPRHPACGPGR